MAFSISAIANSLNATAVGDVSLEIHSIAQPDLAGEHDLAIAIDPKFAELLSASNAKTAVLWEGAEWEQFNLKAAIFVPRPRYALSKLTNLFFEEPHLDATIHPTALIDETASIGENVDIGAYVVIGPHVKIEGPARIHSHVSLANNVTIGANALLYSGVRIGAHVTIGSDFICQMGAVIGSDGFSYVTPKAGSIEEARQSGLITKSVRNNSFVRIDSLGSVHIGDHVEVGANTTIDAGTLTHTRIGSGTKLDNLVQIGHNVVIGEDCLLSSHAAVAGSTIIGDRCVFGGQAGVADHLTIGSDVVVAGAAAVLSHVPSGRVMMGNPAMKMDLNIASYQALRRLPRILNKLRGMLK